MKNKKNLLAVFFFVCIFNANLHARIEFKGIYIPVDSLTNEYTSRYARLHLKANQIDIPIDGEQITFRQVEPTDSTGYLFRIKSRHHYNFINENEYDKTYLQTNELLSVTDDSLYISAVYQKFNLRGDNITKEIKIDKLAVSKADLSGVTVSPPIAEIKKLEKRHGWFIGILGVLIAGLALVFGG